MATEDERPQEGCLTACLFLYVALDESETNILLVFVPDVTFPVTSHVLLMHTKIIKGAESS
jgi:hypothetical protein